jgi:hypothetical protein
MVLQEAIPTKKKRKIAFQVVSKKPFLQNSQFQIVAKKIKKEAKLTFRWSFKKLFLQKREKNHVPSSV